ncbi:MAG: radical SAM protein [Calditrichaeota bacterium]|nr:MAG: radical SAM protein [Calditrichota bacterium]
MNLSSTKPTPNILCINPWIYDFAAYDFWSKPLGLLYIAALLRQRGLRVDFIDCLDRWHPELLRLQGKSSPKQRKGSVGPFQREVIAKPECLRFVPRNYARYGLPERIFISELKKRPYPDVILVTSIMTYWYPGVKRVVECCRVIYPGVPIILGGIYATLMPEHAREVVRPDELITSHDASALLVLLADLFEMPELAGNPPKTLDAYPYPAFDLLYGLNYIILMATRGCPLTCSFCATHQLSGYTLRDPQCVGQEMLSQSKKYQTPHIAFYDDALLMQPEIHIKPILRQLLAEKADLHLHTPNGLHARFIDEELAELIFRTSFRTIRLSLESVAKERLRDIHNKITPGEMTIAVQNLIRAGYSARDIETYVIMALPGQEISEVVETVCYAHSLGVRVRLSAYSPIPGTQDYARAIASGFFPANADPLLTNNSIVPLYRTTKDYWRYQNVSQFAHWLNEKAWTGKLVSEIEAKQIYKTQFEKKTAIKI